METAAEMKNVAQPGHRIAAKALDEIFLKARTCRAWRPDRVPAPLLREVCEPARFGAPASSSRRAHWVLISDRCPDSTRLRSTRNSSRMENGRQIPCATWGTVIPASSRRAIHASTLGEACKVI